MRHKIYIILIFSIGILLRLHTIIRQPLWLDEIYSLYFASNFSVSQIIFHLPDCHPGLFYLILKGLMFISLDPTFLRLILSALPQLIACFIVQHRYKNPLLTTVFLLNPFFIHYAWQIRMYGLVFLICISLIILVTSKKISPHKIILLLFIANLISYSFIIPSFCLLFYLAYTHQKKWLIIIPFILIEFFIFKSSQYKTFAETASWITIPSFTNIPSVILTTLGLSSDINSQNTFSIFSSLIFYFIIGIFIFHQSKKYSLFLFAFTLPLLLTIFISIIFPFLSQHRFFYLFIPKLSLFIPRFLIPLSIIFYLYLFKLIPNYLLLIILIPFWLKTNFDINLTSYNSTNSTLYNQNQLFLPPSENLRLPTNFSKTDLQKISKNYNLTEKIEKQLLASPPNCILYHQSPPITYLQQSIKSLDNYQKELEQSISKCSKSP